MNERITDLDLSRRSFVKSAAGLTLSFALGGTLVDRPAFAADSARFNAWITIGADNIVTILCPMAEMGQGVLTALRSFSPRSSMRTGRR